MCACESPRQPAEKLEAGHARRETDEVVALERANSEPEPGRLRQNRRGGLPRFMMGNGQTGGTAGVW